MSTAFIFPGQGSQSVGMAKALAESFSAARQALQEVDDALGQHLTKIMFEGPESDLTLTENTQPAIMACSIATLRVMEQEMNVQVSRDAAYVAGHSLGEYSALTAAGSLKLSDTARLLRIRGSAMQRAVPQGQGAMAAIIGLGFNDIKALCEEASASGEACEVANYNSDQQIVISGSAAGIEKGMELAKAKGAKRALPLPVSAPFHCSLMKPAADTMRDALDKAAVNDPSVPLIANITADAVEDAATIRRLLVEQVTGMVRWQESVERMVALGVTRFIEIGNGKVLTGLIKRIAPDAACINITSPEDLDAFAKAA